LKERPGLGRVFLFNTLKMTNKKNVKTLLLLLGLIYFAALSMRNDDHISPAGKISVQYHSDLLEMATHLQILADSLDQGGNFVQLQSLFLQARLAYKKASFLADYLDPEYVKDYINGAPLPKLERNYSQIEVLNPKGFQPLEEVLWSEQSISNQIIAKELARELQKTAFDFYRFQKNVQLDDQLILEALRFGLVRLFTLDLTGFDCPASGESLTESKAAFGRISSVTKEYMNLLTQQDDVLAKQLEKSLSVGNKQLAKETDFDNFDRLTFLKSCINPLFADLLTMHQVLGYPQRSVSTMPKVAVNYQANNLFSADFLNPFYFTQMMEADYDSNRIALGKLLFFDPVLSSTNDRACASCHQPEKGFTDGLAKSLATGMQSTVKRNAPTLLNAVYSPRFFWDMRTNLLETQFEHVMVNKDEFNSTMLEVIQKINKSQEYITLFRQTFPVFDQDPISPYTLNTALSAYVVSLRSFNSPFDQYVRGEKAEIATEVKQGFNLFMGKAVCGTCHFAPSFGGIVPPLYQEQESEILGVPTTSFPPYTLDPDIGRAGGVPKESSVIYQNSFKTVTVRNIVLTAPYMHNGAFETLADVIEFYHKGGGAGLGLDVPYQTLPFDSLILDEVEKRALVAFMQSLTDTSGLTERPLSLPTFPSEALNKRVIGGVY